MSREWSDWLVSREALEPVRHRVDGHEGTARVGEEHNEERQAVGGLGRARKQPNCGSEPGDGGDEAEQDARCCDPVQDVRVGAKAKRQCDHDCESSRNGVAEDARRRVAAEQRRTRTSIERNRSTMPPVSSWQTLIAVSAEPKAAQRISTPGTT